MPSLPITLADLKRLQINEITSFKLLPEHVVQLKTKGGMTYLVTGVEGNAHNDRLSLHDDERSITLRIRRDQATTLGLIGSLASVVGLLLSIGLLIDSMRPARPQTVEKRLQELSQIRRSLSELDTYVASQQTNLSQLTQDVAQLEQQKANLAEVVQLNRRQVEALLRFQAEEQARGQYVSLVLSFAIGVLSSIVAALGFRFFERQRARR